MKFEEFRIFIKLLNDYNPTLFDFKNELLRFRPNKAICNLINFSSEMGFNYTEDDFKFMLYNWIEYLLNTHADFITLDSKINDLNENIKAGNILDVNNFKSTSVIKDNRIILSTIKKTAVIGCINDIFVNLKDFDVALLHCPHAALYCQFSDFINMNEITSKINFLNNDQNKADFSSEKNQVIKLSPSFNYLNYLYLFDRATRFAENEIQDIVFNALQSVNNLCPFTKTIVFNGILHPHDNNLNINPLIAAINNFLETTETNFKSIYIITNNREILQINNI
jgi:hypothetical protein